MSYRYNDAANLEGAEMAGSHQCVDLVEHDAHAPATASWRAGTSVPDTAIILPGTAIATFVGGRYRSHAHGNHAALFLRREGDCIWVMDQWGNDSNKPLVSARKLCPKGTRRSGGYEDPSNNADAFSIIE